MARLWTTGFELQSVTNLMEFDVIGSPAISTAVKRSGESSLLVGGSIATSTVEGISHTFAMGATTYQRLAINIDAMDEGGEVSAFMDLMDATATTSAISVQVTNVGGTLGMTIFYNDFATTLTNTASLSFDTWHVIEVFYNSAGAGATDQITVWVDNVQVANDATLTLTTTPGYLQFGVFNGSAGTITGTTVYFDDYGINDTSGSAETGRLDYLGKVVHMHPDGAGDDSDWTNDYQNVDEITPDDATTLVNSGTTIGNKDQHTVEASSVRGIGASDTIKLVSVGGRFNRAGGAGTNGQFRWQLKSASGGTTTNGTTFTASVTTWRTNQNSATDHRYNLTSYTDPTTGVAWTPTGTNSLDNMQIGYDLAAAPSAGREVQVSTVWALVEYVPNVATTSTSSTSSSISTSSTSSSISTSSTSSSISTSSTSSSRSTSTSSTSISISTSSTSSSISTSSTSTSRSTSTSSTSSSISTSSTSSSISTSSTSSSLSTSSTSTSRSTSTSSTSSSVSTSSTSTSRSTSTSSTSSSVSTSSTSTSISTSSTSSSISTSSTSSSISTSISTSSTSQSTSTTQSFTTSTSSTSTSFSTSSTSSSISTSSTSSSVSTSTSSTSSSLSTSTSTSVSGTTTSTSSSTSISTSTTLIDINTFPRPRPRLDRMRFGNIKQIRRSFA